MAALTQFLGKKQFNDFVKTKHILKDISNTDN